MSSSNFEGGNPLSTSYFLILSIKTVISGDSVVNSVFILPLPHPDKKHRKINMENTLNRFRMNYTFISLFVGKSRTRVLTTQILDHPLQLGKCIFQPQIAIQNFQWVHSILYI